MKIYQACKRLIVISMYIYWVSIGTLAFAQSPSPSATPSPSASASPSPSISSSPVPSVTLAADTGGSTKEEVLGETDVLGATGVSEAMKWLIAGVIGVGVFILGIKISRTKHSEE